MQSPLQSRRRCRPLPLSSRYLHHPSGTRSLSNPAHPISSDDPPLRHTWARSDQCFPLSERCADVSHQQVARSTTTCDTRIRCALPPTRPGPAMMPSNKRPPTGSRAAPRTRRYDKLTMPSCESRELDRSPNCSHVRPVSHWQLGTSELGTSSAGAVGATGGAARSEAVRDSVAPCVGVVGDIPKADLLAPHGHIAVWRVRLRQIGNGVPQDLVFLPLRVESTVAVTRQLFSTAAARGIVRPRSQRLSMTKVIAAFLAVPMSR